MMPDAAPAAIGPTTSRSASLDSLDTKEGIPVWRFVLTGGPCGGKTTALSTIADRLRNLGLQVFTVPENATLFSNAGAGFPVGSNQVHQMCWETSRMICQMEMERSFIRIAKSSEKPTVIICDRGVMDAKAYCDDATWQQLTSEMGWDEVQMRDGRYDMVVHMVSTAIGAQQYYQQTVYRRETPQQAAELDDKIKAVWQNHPRRAEIDNSTGFDDKVQRVVTVICRFLGIDAPYSTVTYCFRLDHSKIAPLVQQASSEDEVAAPGGTLDKLRNGTWSRETVFFFPKSSNHTKNQRLRLVQQRRTETESTTLIHGWQSEGRYQECLTTQREFEGMLELAVQSSMWLQFDRLAWMEDREYFEVLTNADFALLRIEVDAGTPHVTIPDWLTPHKLGEVTSQPEWSLFALARANGEKRALRCTGEGNEEPLSTVDPAVCVLKAAAG
eukprot:TRINITY_DN12270_c0_g2_i2.p1 TRINITY_DN12270_c0_g2~~TRINITY_DN12270_c0_g2_i2.p1  ORF type:complete len:442 (+),score=143.13 TRINITY_DN12270_c0_g2_i2:61-1386(+)